MDNDTDRIPEVTPGEILQEEFLQPMGISAYQLAKDTAVPAKRISEILRGRGRITAETALRLSAYFGNSAEFWLGIQDEYDLRLQRTKDTLRPPRAGCSAQGIDGNPGSPVGGHLKNGSKLPPDLGYADC